MLGLYAYAAVLAAISLILPREWFQSTDSQFVLAVGSIAIWRYGWGLTHLVRANIYNHIVFPRWRRAADALGRDGLPSHVYLLVTSFRIDTETTRKVYAAALDDAIACGVRTTLVASIVEMSDQRLVKQLFQSLDPPEWIDLAFVRIAGTGKRDALASAFRAISRLRPPQDAVVAVIDGDSMLEPGLLAGTLPLFKTHPDADALTTDEVCDVVGASIFRDWYNLRFAQRHIQMGSCGLSRRVLTLTGRMSMFRAEVVCDPVFIHHVEQDALEHWRLGTFRFLTGDDKSTWYTILKSGKEMLYVPDVRVKTIEHPPHPDFLTSAFMLMQRWFGNMLRTNSRALALGPGRMGLFTWWCIFDQRISMWTALIGPTGMLLATAFYTPFAPFLYLYWILLSRFIQTISLLTARPEVRWNYPLLLYFNQTFGSAVKTYIMFRLDKQRWTRQKTSFARDTQSLLARVTAQTSTMMHWVAILAFVTFLGFYLGIFRWPSAEMVSLMI